MEQADIDHFTFLNALQDLQPASFWTPLIQLVDPSEELLEKIEYLQHEHEQNKDQYYRSTEKAMEFYENEARNITREIIAEAIEGTGFDFMEDFECLPDRVTKTHGTVPFLIWDRENEHLNYGFPLTIVMHNKIVHDRSLRRVCYEETHFGVAGVAQWVLNRMNNLMKSDKEFAARVKADENLQTFKVLLTNGHNWRLHEFDYNYESRVTHIYRPRSVEEVIAETGEKPVFKFVGDKSAKKIWSDLRQLQLALGLVRFSLNRPTEGEQKLQTMYSYLNDLQSSEIMTEEEKAIIEARAEKSKYLPGLLKKMYVGSTFYLEEKEKEKMRLKEAERQAKIEADENSDKHK